MFSRSLLEDSDFAGGALSSLALVKVIRPAKRGYQRLATLTPILAAAFDTALGGRSALGWE